MLNLLSEEILIPLSGLLLLLLVSILSGFAISYLSFFEASRKSMDFSKDSVMNLRMTTKSTINKVDTETSRLALKAISIIEKAFSNLSDEFRTALSKRLSRDLDDIQNEHSQALSKFESQVSEIGKDVELLSGTQVFIRPLDSLKVTNVNFRLGEQDEAILVDSLSYGLPYLKLPGLAKDPLVIRNYMADLPSQNLTAFLESITRFTLDAELKGVVTVGSGDDRRRQRPKV